MNKKNVDYGKYFTPSEFACQCGCGRTEMDQEFLYMLNTLREDVGFPFKINSGYRCPNHPETIKHPDRAHPKGKAADIEILTSSKRHAVCDRAGSNGIHRIGIAKTFIHLDSDSSRSEAVIWLY